MNPWLFTDHLDGPNDPVILDFSHIQGFMWQQNFLILTNINFDHFFHSITLSISYLLNIYVFRSLVFPYSTKNFYP